MIRNRLFINQFILKILGILFMTLDHIGVCLELVGKPEFATAAKILKIIGRLSLPLILFIMVEGMNKTRNKELYLLRIGIITTVVLVTQIIVSYFNTAVKNAYSPLIDLSIAAITVYLLKRKDKLRILVILPIIFSFMNYIVFAYEDIANANILWLPFFIRSGYSILGLGMAIGFYYAQPLVSKFYASKGVVLDDKSNRLAVNAFSMVTIITVNILFYILSIPVFQGVVQSVSLNASFESWSIVSILFILFYNGNRGYNKPWFKYGCYIYYPLHILILYLIFLLGGLF